MIPPSTKRPATLLVAAVLLAVEALGALIFAALEISEAGLARSSLGAGVALVMGAYGLVLVAVARGALLGRRWSRGPAVATQLILLPLAWNFRASPTTWVAVLMVLVALGLLVALLHPRSTEVFVGPKGS